MSAPVFICPEAADAVVGSLLTLTGGEARHAATVQRREPGERVELVDGHGVRAAGVIVEVRLDSLDVRVDSVSRDVDLEITLVQALAKGNRDEQAVEACTELGVTRVVPWASDRAIVQWRGPKAEKGRSGWESLVLAAAKQSRRALVPAVLGVVSTKELAGLVRAAVGAGERVLVLHETATVPLAGLSWPNPQQPVWVIVGPEGGIADGELEALTVVGGEPVRLGPTVLRASSAGPAALAALAVARGTWC